MAKDTNDIFDRSPPTPELQRIIDAASESLHEVYADIAAQQMPKVEWKDAGVGTEHPYCRATVDGIRLGCDRNMNGLGWEWFVEWWQRVGEQQVKRSFGGGFCRTPDEAKSECEFFLSREWKARQLDFLRPEVSP